MKSTPIPYFQPSTTKLNKFDNFIDWASPFGKAGINHIHHRVYEAGSPWFMWAEEFLAYSDNRARTWFLKQEFLHDGRAVFRRCRNDERPQILNHAGLIPDGRYLRFAKAYLNVMAYYRGYKSVPKPIVLALIFLEKALRDLNGDSNQLEKICALTFKVACEYITKSNYTLGQKYDFGKDLEILSGMLQSGHHSKSFRFEGKGFFLIKIPFSFKSHIAQAPRKRVISQNTSDITESDAKRLSSEHVAAVGLAYQRAMSLYGENSPITFMAALIALPLTTVSMRISELLTLRRDALHTPDTSLEYSYYRFRIYRSKINLYQDLRLPLKLSDIAQELFKCVTSYSAPAQKAFNFYIKKFGTSFEEINELYIPAHLREIFAKEFLNFQDLSRIFEANTDQLVQETDIHRINLNLKVYRFVESVNDIHLPNWKNAPLDTTKYLKVGLLKVYLEANNVPHTFPDSLHDDLYIDKGNAMAYIQKSSIRRQVWYNNFFEEGKKSSLYIRTSELKAFLLAKFKASEFAHWPYISKDRKTKLNEALCVYFESSNLKEGKASWWMPCLVNQGTVNSWISGTNSSAPQLFELFGITNSKGIHPSFTIHQTRKYHHTNALLAGVNELFADEQAGRQSGRQSDHYDLRSPHEILLQSIETFDPDVDFEVKGPIGEIAPPKTKFADRKVFLYENAAPKHITEVGGCRTDWAIDPCEQFGDCMRCDKSVWRKGDQQRLPHILNIQANALKMLSIAEEKIDKGNAIASLVRQKKQYEETIQRCQSIVEIEQDSSIALGTIVTFPAAPNAMSTSLLIQQLRNNYAVKD